MSSPEAELCLVLLFSAGVSQMVISFASHLQTIPKTPVKVRKRSIRLEQALSRTRLLFRKHVKRPPSTQTPIRAEKKIPLSKTSYDALPPPKERSPRVTNTYQKYFPEESDNPVTYLRCEWCLTSTEFILESLKKYGTSVSLMAQSGGV